MYLCWCRDWVVSAAAALENSFPGLVWGALCLVWGGVGGCEIISPPFFFFFSRDFSRVMRVGGDGFTGAGGGGGSGPFFFLFSSKSPFK